MNSKLNNINIYVLMPPHSLTANGDGATRGRGPRCSNFARVNNCLLLEKKITNAQNYIKFAKNAWNGISSTLFTLLDLLVKATALSPNT